MINYFQVDIVCLSSNGVSYRMFTMCSGAASEIKQSEIAVTSNESKAVILSYINRIAFITKRLISPQCASSSALRW